MMYLTSRLRFRLMVVERYRLCLSNKIVSFLYLIFTESVIYSLLQEGMPTQAQNIPVQHEQVPSNQQQWQQYHDPRKMPQPQGFNVGGGMPQPSHYQYQQQTPNTLQQQNAQRFPQQQAQPVFYQQGYEVNFLRFKLVSCIFPFFFPK